MSYIQTLTDFHRIYQNNILPNLKIEEKNRIKEKQSIIYYGIFLIFFVIPLAFFYKKFITTFEDVALYFSLTILSFMIAFLIIIFCFITRKKNKSYKNKLKHSFLDLYLQAFENIKWYEKNDFILDKDIKHSGLVPYFDKVLLDESYIGDFKNINIAIAEKTLYKKSQKNDDITNYFNDVVFKGCFIVLKTNKNIKNRTIITNKSSRILKNIYLKLGTIIIISLLLIPLGIPVIAMFLLLSGSIIYLLTTKESIKDNNENLKKMQLEDIRFNNMYLAYSSNQVEGRYAVTPAFMERLLNLKLAFKAKNIGASFFDDKLMIAIETDKDLFEIGDLWHPLTDIKYANNYYDEMYSILHMVEYFKLDKKTGL